MDVLGKEKLRAFQMSQTKVGLFPILPPSLARFVQSPVVLPPPVLALEEGVRENTGTRALPKAQYVRTSGAQP
jgi:hypothetical protein